MLPQARVGGVAPPGEPGRGWRTAQIALGAGCGAWMISVNPIVGGAFVASGLGYAAWKRRRRSRWAADWTRDIAEMWRLLAAGELNALEALLARRDRIRTNAIGSATLSFVRGELLWARGDLEGAYGAHLLCTQLLRRPVRGYAGVYWASRFAVANLLFDLRRLDAAAGACARAFEAPAVPRLAMARAGLETHHALVHDRPEALGDAAAIAARVTLARANAQPLVMTVLAWALERLGDRDGAAALAAEARTLVEPKGRDFWRRRFPRAWAALAPRMELEP